MKRHNVVALSMMSFMLTIAVIVTVLVSAQKSRGDVVFAKTPTSASMTGAWHQVDGTSEENMVAQIDHGKIQIILYLGNARGVYWDGSFDFDQPHANAVAFNVVSESNHPNDIFSSELDNKTFAYKNGILSYEFKIVGTTRIVKLQKEGN